jgi:L-lysine 2,3-aminomutase
MKIESFFPGRLRVSSPLFMRREAVDTIRKRVESMDGVKDVSVNARIGSLTVLYDPSRITMPMLMNAKEEIERLESKSVSYTVHGTKL